MKLDSQAACALRPPAAATSDHTRAASATRRKTAARLVLEIDADLAGELTRLRERERAPRLFLRLAEEREAVDGDSGLVSDRADVADEDFIEGVRLSCFALDHAVPCLARADFDERDRLRAMIAHHHAECGETADQLALSIVEDRRLTALRRQQTVIRDQHHWHAVIHGEIGDERRIALPKRHDLHEGGIKARLRSRHEQDDPPERLRPLRDIRDRRLVDGLRVRRGGDGAAGDVKAARLIEGGGGLIEQAAVLQHRTHLTRSARGKFRSLRWSDRAARGR
jgi:hypothetical protein